MNTLNNTTTIVKTSYDFSTFFVVFSNESVESIVNSPIIKQIEEEYSYFDGIAIVNPELNQMHNTSDNSDSVYCSQFDHLQSKAVCVHNLVVDSIPFAPFI